MTQFLYAYEAVIGVALINIVLTYSLYIVFRAGMWALHQAGALAVAAYTVAYLETAHDWSFWAALALAVPTACVVILFLVAPTLRLQGVYLAIATIALSEALRFLAINLDVTGGAAGLVGLEMFDGLGAVASITVVLVVVMAFLDRSRLGQRSIVHARSPILAQSLGTNLVRFRLTLVTISCAYAGLAAGMATGITPIVEPGNFAFDRVVELLAFLVIGGTRSFWGPVVGVLALTVPVELLQGLQEYRLFFYALMTLGVLVFLPTGLSDRDQWARAASALRRLAKRQRAEALDRERVGTDG
jgi:branched-chain amino acid transport system permease protein